MTGTLAAALLAKRLGLGLVCPEANLAEALMIDGPEIYAVSEVTEALDVARGAFPPRADARGIAHFASSVNGPDLAEVRGQYLARRALDRRDCVCVLLGERRAWRRLLAQSLSVLSED